MIPLHSITTWFATHGTLRKSQRTTITALTWAFLRNPVLGIAAMGRSLVMAAATTAKHAMKRVHRFLGDHGERRPRSHPHVGLDGSENVRRAVPSP